MDTSDNEQEIVEENIAEDSDSEIEVMDSEESSSIKNGVHNDEQKFNNNSSEKLSTNFKNINNVANSSIKRETHTITQEYVFETFLINFRLFLPILF